MSCGLAIVRVVGEYVDSIEIVQCAEGVEVGVVGVGDQCNCDVASSADGAGTAAVDGPSGIDVMPEGVDQA